MPSNQCTQPKQIMFSSLNNENRVHYEQLLVYTEQQVRKFSNLA